MCFCERMRERERGCVCESLVRVFVCVWERARENVCVDVCLFVCVCERETEKERERDREIERVEQR